MLTDLPAALAPGEDTVRIGILTRQHRKPISDEHVFAPASRKRQEVLQKCGKIMQYNFNNNNIGIIQHTHQFFPPQISSE